MTALQLPVRTGTVHDFDFLVGDWTVENRTLKPGPGGADTWLTFPGVSSMRPQLDGVVNVEEQQFTTKGTAGLALRIFDVEKRRWAIYWVQSGVGVLLPPVYGGFGDTGGDRGEFFGHDELDGVPVIYRFVWTRLGPDRARWEQAYTIDGATWTVNWVMDFTRRPRVTADR